MDELNLENSNEASTEETYKDIREKSQQQFFDFSLQNKLNTILHSSSSFNSMLCYKKVDIFSITRSDIKYLSI